MKKFTRVTTVIVVGVSALSFAGCANNTVTGHGDYPAYSSVDQLAKDADLIVEVTVGDSHFDLLNPSMSLSEDPALNPSAGSQANQAPDAEEVGIPITVYDTVVNRVLAGDSKSGSHLEVKQMGGESDEVTLVDDGTVPLKPGQTYVLYLETYDDAPASILGGSAGQFVREGDAYRSQYVSTPLPFDSKAFG